jgi:hypothetical protein
LLKVAVRLANYTCDQVGPAPKNELVPNHALAEEAFGNLYLFFRDHPELKREMPSGTDEGSSRKSTSIIARWTRRRHS